MATSHKTRTPPRKLELPAQRAGSFAGRPMFDQRIRRDNATVRDFLRFTQPLMANPRARVAPRSSGSPHASNDTATQPASSGPPLTGSYANTDASNHFIAVSQVARPGTEQAEVDVTVRNQSGSLISVGEPLLGTAAGGIMTLWPPSGGATTASYSTNRASVSFNPADRQSWISWPGGTPSTCVFNLENGG